MKRVNFIIVLVIMTNVSIHNAFGQGGAVAIYQMLNAERERNKSAEQNREQEASRSERNNNIRRGMTDPGYDNTFFLSATKRAAEKNVNSLLVEVNNALKIAVKNKNTKYIKTGKTKIYHIKPGTFQVKRQKDKPREYIGKFYEYNFRISSKYIYISNHRLCIDYSDGHFHTSDFSNIPPLEDFMISILEDVSSK